MPLLTWEQIAGKEYKDPPFLLDPYIPRGGIVFLWGDTSIGKSPLTWEIARCVASGQSFFGLPTIPSRVLYIEVDTPEQTAGQRLKKIYPVKGVWFLFMEPLSIPLVTPEELSQLEEARKEVDPDLVIVNTLRNCHDFDDRESRVPKLVYSFFRKMFRGAAVLFVSHNRKAPLDPRVEEVQKESFSGSKHFIDDAQVGLHLAKFRRRDGRENLRLYHMKTQASEELRPLPLRLHGDGSTLTSPLYEELLDAYMALHDERSGVGKGELDKMLAEKHNISLSTARTRRAVVERGFFPGSRAFLSPSTDDTSEEDS